MRIRIVKRDRGSWDRTNSRQYVEGEEHDVPSQHMDALLAMNFLYSGTAVEIEEMAAVGPAETKPEGPAEFKPDGPEEAKEPRTTDELAELILEVEKQKASDDEPITSSFVADPEGAAASAAAHEEVLPQPRELPDIPQPKPSTRRRSTRRKKGK